MRLIEMFLMKKFPKQSNNLTSNNNYLQKYFYGSCGCDILCWPITV